MTYAVTLSGPAKRALAERLPLGVAEAVIELLRGALAEHPRRVGKLLKEPYGDTYSARRGEYRVLYRIDDDVQVITVDDIRHRRDAYR